MISFESYMARAEECLKEVRLLYQNQLYRGACGTKRDSTALNELFELRQSGEYDMEDSVSEADALSSISIAAEFLVQAEAYLRS